MKLALALVLGLVLGAACTALVQPTARVVPSDPRPLDASTEPPAAAAAPDRALPGAPHGDARVDDDAPPRAPTGARRADASDPLFSTALLAHHDAEYARGWREVRDGDIEPAPALLASAGTRFREGVLALSASLGERDAEDANERDALARSLETLDVTALLEFARGGVWRPEPGFLRSDRFEALWTPGPVSATVDGATFAADRNATLEAGVTLSFPVGVHVLDERRLADQDGVIPADVTLIGAGKDATLLRIGDISSRGFLQHLTIRDMTLDADNDGLFDLRVAGALVDLQRVRIVRFDAAHGGCTTLSSSKGGLYRLRDVDFVGGYGRSPGRGDLMDGSPILASFENCRFERIEMTDLTPGQGSQVRFTDCHFITESDPIRQEPGLAFERCRYEPLEPEDITTKPLSELFPGAQ